MRSEAASRARKRVIAAGTAEITFKRLYEAHYAAVLGYCRRRIGPGDAHDATNEVFAIAWKKISEVPDGDRARVWLYGVAYRVLGHHYRSRRRRGRLEHRLAQLATTPAPNPDVLVVQRAQDRQVREAAARLREADQEILRLAAWEDLPHAEIADVLGLSVSAVDQRFHRAKQRLAREFDRLNDNRPPTSAQEGGRA